MMQNEVGNSRDSKRGKHPRNICNNNKNKVKIKVKVKKYIFLGGLWWLGLLFSFMNNVNFSLRLTLYIFILGICKILRKYI